MRAWTIEIGLGFLTFLLAGTLYRVWIRKKRLETALNSSLNQLEHLQNAFHRFAPKNVVEEIISRGLSVRSEHRHITVLFADLVGFTTLSEKLEPTTLVNILNGYFRAMSRAIVANRGHLSKFIGDGLLALFGVPDPNPWHAVDAVEASLAMRNALANYNQELERKKLPQLSFGVGLHSGVGVVGVIGSDELMEYTAVGDVVNVASRIEGFTRQLKADILISDAVRQHLDNRYMLNECGPMEVKGKSEKIVVHALSGLRSSVKK